MKERATHNETTHGLSRRGFLGLLGNAGAGAAMSLRAFDAVADVVPHRVPTYRKVETLGSVCAMCVNRCGIRARVVDGVLEKIDGDPRNPNSRGGTCAKGQAGIMQVYDPDRIRYPMIRVGERGAGKWRRASWDEAYAYVADNLVKIIEKHGPESLFWSSTTDLTETFFVKLGTYLGTQNNARHATLCLASRNVGYFASMGGVPEIDLANSKYILMYGANRLESFELPYNIDLVDAVQKGGKLVVVDPRMTYTAAKGEWLPIRPRTDLALNLALMHVLINEELYDKEFVANRTVGFEALKAHVAQNTPEWAEKETEIPADKIRQMAREMAAAAPAVAIFPGRRTSWYTNDTIFRQSMGMLTGLLGAVDAPGAAYFGGDKAKLGSYSWAIEPVELAPKFDGFVEKFPLANHEDGGYVHMRDAILNGTAKNPVKGWMIYHQNPLVGVLDSNKTLEMMKQMDFIGVIDIQPSQTAWMADIILPETTYLERLDPVWAPASTPAFMAIRQPVVATQGEAQPVLEIIKGIAKELDKRHEFETPITEAFDFTMEEYVDAQLKGTALDRAGLMKEGIWVAPTNGLKFGQFRSGEMTFKTPSGKLEFVSERFIRNGYPGLPVYASPREEPGKQRLITGRHAWFTHSFNQNNKWLNALYPENEVWINPAVAKEKGINDGEYVKVKSSRGEIRIKAKVTPRIRKDTVFICHGFGGEKGGQTTLAGRGGPDQVLMESAADEISNNQAMHETFVEVLKG
ncbi:MAG: molybdopterin-dependent oxidoreductase [Gammaproteobacteria bacterium]|nr:molybdopterin-dependent oxidoreductase [Gammaproteobacteria bacterium]